jgi:hypothetical protein
VNHGNSNWLERSAIALVVVAVCLSMLRNVLPHLVPSIVVLGIVVVVVLLVFDRTRRW